MKQITATINGKPTLAVQTADKAYPVSEIDFVSSLSDCDRRSQSLF